MCAAPLHRILAGPGAGMARGPLVRPVQSGDVNPRVLYVFAVTLLAYLLGAV